MTLMAGSRSYSRAAGLHPIDPLDPGSKATDNAMNKTLVTASTAIVLALSAGCASQRISSALEKYGVPRDKAECVGDSLSDRLSFSQLQALNRAAGTYRDMDRSRVSLTLLDLARVAAEIRDPVIPLEIVRAGVKCAVLPSSAMLGLSR